MSARAPAFDPQPLRHSIGTAAATLSTHRDRANFIAMHPELVRAEVVALLSGWIPTLVRTDPRNAGTIADLAHLVARRLNDAESLALAFRSKANLFHVSGKNRAAVRCHERARVLFAQIGNRTQVARTLSGSIQPLILLGQYERAYAAAQEARSIFEEDGNDWRIARVELNTGNIFDRQDRFAEALECYQSAYRQLWAHRGQDPEGVAVALHNMAGCYVCLNDFHLAYRTYEEARSFARQHSMPALVAQADYNIATLHYLRGEYSRAIQLLQAARQACEASGDRYHFALCHLNLCEIYLEMNMGCEAEEAGVTAQAAFHRLGMRYEEGKAATNIGIALGQQGQFSAAVKSFDRARALFLSESNAVWISLIDLFQALMLFKNNRFEEARTLATAALRFFRKSVHVSKVVSCYLLLARLHMKTGRHGMALKDCARAMVHLRSVESPMLTCQAHSLMGQVLRSLEKYDKAYEHFRLATGILEQLRGGIHSDELKISFLRDRMEIYENLIDLCIHQRQPDTREIFHYIEQAKSRSLLELATSMHESEQAPRNEASRTSRIRELRQELSWYQHRVEMEQVRDRAGMGHQLAHLQAEAQKRERELLRFQRDEASAVQDVPGAYTGPAMDLETIQQSLAPAATIVEYFLIGDQVVIALLTRQELKIISAGTMTSPERLLARLRFQIAKPRLGKDYAASFQYAWLAAINDCLHQLYDQLIAPIRSLLRTPHLIIVPHGALHHLPFHAFFDGGQYLLDEFSISYAPSASVYTFCDSRSANSEGPALVLGLSDSTIPAVDAEAEAVAQILPKASLLLSQSVTREILTEKGPHLRFLHVATHGQFRPDQPMFSGIRLSDGSLSLFDLYQLRLPVELATLSGCSTGLNVVSGGDEILGLARGLICAGAQSALLSLWDVQDQSTAEFMRSFYQRLTKTEHKAAAVREAALELRKSYPHPYFWAPFVLIGKNFRN